MFHYGTLSSFLLSSFIVRVKDLLDEHGLEYVKTRDPSGHTLLHWAALAGSTELVEFLLQHGALLDVHSDNDYGPRPIHWACVHGHVTVIDQFLEKGVSIETMDYNRCTPLLIAAQYGQSLVISYLLKKGANKDHVDINKDMALHWAAYKGRVLWKQSPTMMGPHTPLQYTHAQCCTLTLMQHTHTHTQTHTHTHTHTHTGFLTTVPTHSPHPHCPLPLVRSPRGCTHPPELGPRPETEGCLPADACPLLQHQRGCAVHGNAARSCECHVMVM